MGVLARLETFLFESSRGKLIAALLALSFVKTGVWSHEVLVHSQRLASNPFVDSIADPRGQYLMWNWLSPFLGWLLGATSPIAFFLMHLAFSAAFTALFIHLAFARLPDEAARVSLLLFTLLPVSATAYFWVGYDSISLFLLLLALAYPERLVLAGLAGALLGVQHFEQGLFGAGGLLLAILLSRRQGEATTYSLRHALALLIGVAIGKAALAGLFWEYAIEIKMSRLDWLRPKLGQIISQFFRHFQYAIFAIFGVGWLAAFKYADYSKNPSPFFRALFALSSLMLITEDQTRVVAIITFPLVLCYWLFDEGFLRAIRRREAAVAFLFWILTPWAWISAGEPRWSAFPYDMLYIMHLFTGRDVPLPVWSFPPI